ncbi:lysophospholipid acyltransferase family protein [Candidatus Omnitrophota bacterium]
MGNYLSFLIVKFLSVSLPLKARYGVARFLADIRFYFAIKDRRAVIKNLKIISPEGDLSKKAKEVFRSFAKYLVDFFRTHLLNEEYIQKKIEIVGLDHLDNALKKGNGVVALSAHIGNWELGAVIVSMLGYPIAAIALPHKSKKVNDLFNFQRGCKGFEVIPLGSAARKSFETLKNNHILAVAGDRDFANSGFVMDFFGKKTMIPKGAAVFSVKTKAPIVPIFLIRKHDDYFRFIFGKPIEPPKNADDKEALSAYTQKCVSIIESYIRAYPTQWLMFRKFWIEQ